MFRFRVNKFFGRFEFRNIFWISCRMRRNFLIFFFGKIATWTKAAAAASPVSLQALNLQKVARRKKYVCSQGVPKVISASPKFAKFQPFGNAEFPLTKASHQFKIQHWTGFIYNISMSWSPNFYLLWNHLASLDLKGAFCLCLRFFPTRLGRISGVTNVKFWNIDSWIRDIFWVSIPLSTLMKFIIFRNSSKMSANPDPS